MNLEELMASTPPMQQHALIKGFQAGAASRDAEIAKLVAALERCREYMELPAQNRTVQPYSEVCEALAKVRKP